MLTLLLIVLLQITEELRKQPLYASLPIIMVTARSTELDIVKGLENGADDYITQPFSVLEFISRVRSLLRRTAYSASSTGYDGLVLNAEEHRVSLNGQDIILTKKEFDLLQLLLENRDKVISREIILDKVWGFDFEGESRTIDMHIKTLRQKVGEWGNHIVTIRKVGYVVK